LALLFQLFGQRLIGFQHLLFVFLSVSFLTGASFAAMVEPFSTGFDHGRMLPVGFIRGKTKRGARRSRRRQNHLARGNDRSKELLGADLVASVNSRPMTLQTCASIFGP